MKRSGGKIMLGLMKLLKPLAPVMLACITLGTLGYLAAIFITVIAADLVLQGLDMAPWAISFGWGAALMIICAVARSVLRYSEQTCGHYIAFKLLAVVRDRVFGSLRKLAPAKLEGKGRGNLISLITGDIELLEVFYAHTIAPIAIAIIVSLIMTIVIMNQNVVMGLIALASYVIVGILIPLSTSAGRNEGAKARNEIGRMSSQYLECLRGVQEILQYEQQNIKGAELKNSTRKVSEAQGKIRKHEGITTSWSGLAVMGLTIIMIMVGAAMKLDFSTILMTSIMLSSSFGPVLAIANLSATLEQTLASGDRVLDLLEEKPETEDVTNGIEPEFTGAEVRDLSFAYDNELVLNHANAVFPKGEIIAVTGESGSGKSTMLKLLMRFWKAEKDSVLISEKDVGNINTEHLRKIESYMIQDTDLFHDSISSNIKIGKLDATQEEIEEAAKKASVHEFILSLPQGYDTPVGELGDTLSGGERQRIGLARAFLHQAPLMLLDEPTSNLDSLNEGIVLKALKERTDDSTVVIVSHRKSTTSIADREYYVENGQISVC